MSIKIKVRICNHCHGRLRAYLGSVTCMMCGRDIDHQCGSCVRYSLTHALNGVVVESTLFEPTSPAVLQEGFFQAETLQDMSNASNRFVIDRSEPLLDRSTSNIRYINNKKQGSLRSMNNNFSEMLKRAEVGDSNAEFQTGLLYYYGDLKNGITVNVDKGLKWLSKAATHSHPDAIYILQLLGAVHEERCA